MSPECPPEPDRSRRLPAQRLDQRALVEEGRRRAVEEEAPPVQHEHPLGVGGDERQVVRDEEHGPPGPVEFDHLVHQGVEVTPVLAGRGLVQDQDVGLHRQDRGDGHTLALAAREGLWGAGGEWCEPVVLHRPGDAARDVVDPVVGEAETDLAGHGVHEELVVGVLKQVPDAAGELGDLLAGGVPPADEHPPVRRLEEPDQVGGDRRLAGPVPAHQGDELTGSDSKRDVVKDPRSPVPIRRDVVELDHGRALPLRGSAPGRRSTSPPGPESGENGVVRGVREPELPCKPVPLGRMDPDPGEAAGRVRQRPERGFVQDETTLVHHQAAVGILGHLLQVMLDQQDGDALALEPAECLEHLPPPGRIEVRGRFVQYQQAGTHCERAGDRDALSFTAREGHDHPVGKVPDSHSLQGVLDPRTDLVPWQSQVLRPEGDVLAHGHAEELQVGVLEDHGDALCELRDAEGTRQLPVDCDRPRRSLTDQPLYEAGKGGLPAPARAGQYEELPFPCQEGDVLHRGPIGPRVAVTEMLNNEHGL
ncbi:hypothetical protein DSECCO2_515470 [anaerobic digester metagenome]